MAIQGRPGVTAFLVRWSPLALLALAWELAPILQNNEEWNDIMTEIELKHIGSRQIPPEYRMIMVLGSFTHSLHKLNTKGEIIAKETPSISKISIPKEVVDKYRHLF